MTMRRIDTSKLSVGFYGPSVEDREQLANGIPIKGRVATRAIVRISSEALPKATALIADHGLEIIGCLASDWEARTIPLVIQGDALPSECDRYILRGKDIPEVKIIVASEVYGSQRITRITGIEVVPAETQVA